MSLCGRTIARRTAGRYKQSEKPLCAWIWQPAPSCEGPLKMAIEFGRVVPTFRIFSLEKAREFYLGFLGFKVDWEHRFDPEAPVYMQVSRDGLVFHLSEHHGDGTPGSTAYVYMTGVEALHRELSEKKYKYNRPGIQKQEWGMLELQVVDPFSNRITFGEPHEKPSA
jgi:catechol 2,3-dioxygenase-like lactoylglutathione lyase family enzyme